MKLILVSDLHGDIHWKRGLKYFNENSDSIMIFLGDYLDPYTRYDGITHEDAYNNFLEVLEFTKANPLRVILLRGNHDENLFEDQRESCRHDYYNLGRNRKLFRDNVNLFRFAYKEGDYLITHAGVCNKWLQQNQLEEIIDENNIVDYLNNNPKTLWQIGASRGGRGYGSPLWCCWEGDWPYVNNPFNLVQVFSHTWDPDIHNVRKDLSKRIMCIDCRECFLLDTETGEINLLS